MNLPSWIQLHGAFTHFPIALLMVGAALELWAFFLAPGSERARWLRQVSLLLLAVAVLAALPSIVTGYLHGRNLRFPPVQYDAHWKLGVVSTVLAALVLLVRLLAKDQLKPAWRLVSSLGLFGATLVVGYTGHLGGEMVFGTNSAADPPLVASTAPAATPVPSASGSGVPGSTALRLDKAAGQMAASASKLEGASQRLAQVVAKPTTPAPVPLTSGPPAPGLDRAAARLEIAAARYEKAAERLEQVVARLQGQAPPVNPPRTPARTPAPAKVASKPASPSATAPAVTTLAGKLYFLDPQLVGQGAKLVVSGAMDCLSCHNLGGKGGRSSTVLEGAGTRNPDPDWHLRHLKNPAAVVPGSKMPAYNWEEDATLKESEVRAMAMFLASLK